MSEILLATDDIARAQRLVREIGTFRRCTVHDLYDNGPLVALPEILVADVKMLTSDAILRLRAILKAMNGAGVPFLFLMHDNGPRAHLQAMALGATTMLSATAAAAELVNTIASLCGFPEPLILPVRRQAAEARQFLEKLFADRSALTPGFVETGTQLVATAVREAGIRDWVRAVRCFDDATHQHCLLVAGLAAAFSGELGLSDQDRHRLTKAALLHDVGKTHVPRHILNKAGPLDGAETTVMRSHPTQGHAMLTGRGFEEIILSVVRSHHEMLDGSGYPDKLKGAEIPDLVRLVTICDIYGALIEHRPYRSSMPYEKAYGILQGMSGRLDDDLVGAFRPVALAFGSFPDQASNASVRRPAAGSCTPAIIGAQAAQKQLPRQSYASS